MLGLGSATALFAASGWNTDGLAAKGSQLPVDAIKRIMQVRGDFSDGVLNIDIGRNDLTDVTAPAGPGMDGRCVPFSAGFELGGEFVFQCIGVDEAIMHGDFPFLPGEIDTAIDSMVKGGLSVQAPHQHYVGLDPMVWFMHFRGIGAPLDLARAGVALVGTTAAKLPQKKSDESTTKLDKESLGKILGAKADFGDGGVVNVVVPRVDRIRLAGIAVNSHLNVSSNISSQQLADGSCAAAPDFAMTAAEIAPVMRLMRANGWAGHCLYNQETNEKPQLYFSHMLKVGEQKQLAREIREALDRTATKRA